MSEWKLVDVEGIGSGYACLTLDGVSTTKSRNLIQADRGAGGDGLGFSDLGTLLIDYADRDIAGVVGITGDQGGIRELEKQRKALQGNVKLLKAVETVKPDLDAIQPEKTLTGAVKGVTVEQVKELKAAVIRGAAAEQKVRELKVENQQLQQKIPSMKEKLKEAQERQRLENENRQLKVQVEYLEKDLSWERGISARLQEGIGAVLDFLDQHLPEQFRPLVEKARELLPVPEVQQPEREQERGHTWGGMEL